MHEALAAQPATKLARWLRAADLPPVVVGQHCLNQEQVGLLLGALQRSKLDAPHPLISALKQHADAASLDAFVWALFEQWLAKVQAVRLEQAMVIGRQWTRYEFETLLVRQPLVTHLVRRLIWAAYDSNGRLAATFRVREDQVYADSADDTFDLTPFNAVRIVHPLYLSQSEQSAWGEVLSDYEIVPPFPQLGRPIHRLEPDELAAKEITRFNQLSIPAASLVFGLDKFGWVRDAPADAGGFCGHSKPFEQANVTAVVQYEEGVAVGYIVDAPDQRLRYLAFVPGIRVFCLVEDMSASNERYATVHPRDYAAIGIPHPADVPLERRLAWSDLLHDFQIMPLFSQTSRPVYDLATVDVGRTSITRFAAIWLKAGTIAQLHRRHWRGGGYEEHNGQAGFYSVRRFEGARITAVTRNQSQIEHSHQRSERCQECFFVRGLLEKYRREDEHVPIALDEVPPVVLSETISDWTDLVNNPKYRYEG